MLRLLRSHMTNQEIADALYLSVNTVKTHLRAVYHKLGVSSRREAVDRGRRLRCCDRPRPSPAARVIYVTPVLTKTCDAPPIYGTLVL